MQIVIDLPDDVYSVIVKQYRKDKELQTRDNLYKAVANGTVIPKGHGRLIDADAVLAEPFGNTYKDIDIAETIIEADKKYEAKVITRGNCMMCGKELTEGLFLCKECGDKANSGR